MPGVEHRFGLEHAPHLLGEHRIRRRHPGEPRGARRRLEVERLVPQRGERPQQGALACAEPQFTTKVRPPWTGVGTARSVVVASPTCSYRFHPQQYATPDGVSAQV